MAKCASYVESLLRASADSLLAAMGAAGDAAVKRAGDGKPLDKLTLGQYIKLLQDLDEPLSRLVADDARLAGIKGPLFGKVCVKLLDRVSRLRSDFVHGRWPVEGTKS